MAFIRDANLFHIFIVVKKNPLNNVCILFHENITCDI